MPRTRSPLAGLSTAQIHAELRTREKKLARVRRQYNSAVAKVARLEAQMRDLGGAVTGGRGGGSGTRARNAVPLHTALHNLLKGKTMGAADAADALLKSGFRTTARTFRTMVNIALIKNKNLFKRIERGQYTSK